MLGSMGVSSVLKIGNIYFSCIKSWNQNDLIQQEMQNESFIVFQSIHSKLAMLQGYK